MIRSRRYHVDIRYHQRTCRLFVCSGLTLCRCELARRDFFHRRISLIGCGRIPECDVCYDLKSDVVKQLPETLLIVMP
jgi:hypothetical protein